jgi:hypothetical protein
MANIQTANMKGQVPSPAITGAEAFPVRATIVLSSFATTDVYEMLTIPVGARVVDWSVDVDDIDSGTAAIFKVGVLNSGKTDLDSGNAVWKTGLTTGQAGGVARMDTLTALRAGVATSERVVGIIATTGPNTFSDTAGGVLGITVWLSA